MRRHAFERDPIYDTCELCGQSIWATVHDTDPDPEPASTPDNFPPTTRAFLDSSGHRDPQGT